MTTKRKLDALRALAERPGTPAEGIAARKALKRLEAKDSKEKPVVRTFVFQGTFTDGNEMLRQLDEAMARYRAGKP